MNEAVVARLSNQDGPRSRVRGARIAGAWYLLLAVTGAFSFQFLPSLTVQGDAAATARNILNSPIPLQVGIIAELTEAVVSILLALALYRLLKDVNRGNAILMVILGAIVSVPIYFVNVLTEYAALATLGGAHFLSVFSTPQQA